MILFPCWVLFYFLFFDDLFSVFLYYFYFFVEEKFWVEFYYWTKKKDISPACVCTSENVCRPASRHVLISWFFWSFFLKKKTKFSEPVCGFNLLLFGGWMKKSLACVLGGHIFWVIFKKAVVFGCGFSLIISSSSNWNIYLDLCLFGRCLDACGRHTLSISHHFSTWNVQKKTTTKTKKTTNEYRKYLVRHLSPGHSRTALATESSTPATTVVPPSAVPPPPSAPVNNNNNSATRTTTNGIMSSSHYGDPGRVLVLPPTSSAGAAAAAAAAAAFNYGAMAHFAGLSLENFNNHMSNNSTVDSATQQPSSHHHHHHSHQTQHHHHHHQFDLSSSVEDSVLAAATLINQLSPQEPTYVNL